MWVAVVGKARKVMETTRETAQRTDTCDVVVVGAGIVGATVAARLTQAGRQVAVLDAQEVAGGATGRSAGMVIAGLPGHYSWAVGRLGRGQARDLWKLTIEGRRRLTEAAVRMGVHPERSGSLALAVTQEEAEALQSSAELLQQDGFDAHFEPADPTGRGFLAALRQPDDIVVDAAELARALLSSAPIAVHANTEVYDLEPDGEMVRVWAQGRTVRCTAAVLAVDGYAPLLDRFFAGLVSPGRALLIATEPISSQALPAPCYADYGYEYARPLRDGRLVLGSWRRPGQDAGRSGPSESVRAGLSRFIGRYFPEAQKHIASRRAGVMGLTPDGLPIIGSLPYLPQVAFAIGFGGWGLAWAFVAAERLAALVLEGAEPGLLAADRLG